MEFFGVPVNDEILLQAPAVLVLSTGKGFVDGQTYNDHHCRLSGTSEEKVLQSFFESLATMTIDLQEQCFQSLLSELNGSEGTKHVAERLGEGMLAGKI